MVRSSFPAVLAQASLAEPNPLLVAIAVLATVGAAIGLLAIYRTTRPNRPAPGPSSMDLGPEPPAIVDLLVGGFEVEDDAVTATVVDLAARRHLSIEEVAGGNVVVRLRRERATPDPLTRYEQRIIDHIERKAVDGVVPAAALTTGPEGVADRWFRRFAHDVYAHGRELGLCHRRFDLIHLVLAWMLVATAWAPALVASSFTGSSGATVGPPSAANLVLGMCFVVNLVLAWGATRLTRSDAHADTPAGLAAASRWLGVQEHLGTQASFAEAPAASVVLWDRLLGYATAMGLAPVVQAQLPFETEHDRAAWSQMTGRWRRVKVRYWSPRPGWGEHPFKLALVGLIQGAIYGVIAWAGWQLANEGLEIDELTGDQQRLLGLIGLAVASLGAIGVLYAAIRVVLGVADLFPRRTVEGDVLRRRELRTGHRLPKWLQWIIWERRRFTNQMSRAGRGGGVSAYDQRHGDRRRKRYYVAVDDGTASSVTAYRVRPNIYRQMAQGANVRLRVSPIIGYVAKVEVLRAPPTDESAVAHGLVDVLGPTAGGALAQMGAGLLAKVAGVAEGVTDEQGRALLDVPDEHGITPRQRMAEAQQQLGQIPGAATPDSVATGDGVDPETPSGSPSPTDPLR